MDTRELDGVSVHSDGENVWTQCRRCGTVISDYWVMPAELRQLADDAVDHYCGIEPTEVPG